MEAIEKQTLIPARPFNGKPAAIRKQQAFVTGRTAKHGHQ
jgi:hypothetical protein